MYSDIVKDHFQNPRNVGVLEKPDAEGNAKNEVDGDMVQLHLRISEGKITDVRMKVMGCVAAIASTSFLTEMIKGMSLDDANHIAKETLAENMGGLPEHKMRCSLTCIDALQEAIQNYQK